MQDAFWASAIAFAEDEHVRRTLVNAASLAELNNEMRRRAFKRRSVLAGVLTIGSAAPSAAAASSSSSESATATACIGFRMYSTVRSAETGKVAWLDADTNAPLTCETKWVCKDTGALLEDFQIRTYYSYGGEKVFITRAEMGTLKQVGMCLLYAVCSVV